MVVEGQVNPGKGKGIGNKKEVVVEGKRYIVAGTGRQAGEPNTEI